MTDSVKAKKDQPDKRIMRSGIAGVIFGVFAILACELPIILALLGFSSLSASAMVLSPPPLVEKAAIGLALAGALLLLSLGARRLISRRPNP